jgi:hypothetical protein
LSLQKKIQAWNGKSADDIKAVYDSYHAQSNFADTIIKLAKDNAYQKGATWLLKAWLESGNKLESDQIKTIYSTLNGLEHWESKLHVLQSIPFMPIEKAERKKIETFLRETLTDPNKLLRAWSYNGFYELATQHSEYLNETKQIFEMAMRDEAASVKARIRNIMKDGF